MTEVHEFVEREGKPTAEVWEIPRRVWLVLMSWGLALFVSFGLLSYWIWHAQREAEQERDALRARQDRAMCVILDLSSARAQGVKLTPDQAAVLKAMNDYRATLTGCPSSP